jgi:hypothetical protein
MTVASAFAQMLAMKIRNSQNQFRPGTAPRLARHVHDRSTGPNSRTSIHMLVRSVNMGYSFRTGDGPHIHPCHKRTAA